MNGFEHIRPAELHLIELMFFLNGVLIVCVITLVFRIFKDADQELQSDFENIKERNEK